MIFSIKPKIDNKLFGDLRKMKHTLYKNCPQVQFVDNLCAICVNLQNNFMSCFGLIDKKIQCCRTLKKKFPMLYNIGNQMFHVASDA